MGHTCCWFSGTAQRPPGTLATGSSGLCFGAAEAVRQGLLQLVAAQQNTPEANSGASVLFVLLALS